MRHLNISSGYGAHLSPERSPASTCPTLTFSKIRHERGEENRGRVSLGQEQLRAILPDHPAKPLKTPLSHVVQALSLLHDPQVFVGVEVEHIQNLVYQPFVLPGEYQAAVQARAVPQRSLTTGAILMASGRVPTTTRTRGGKSSGIVNDPRA